MVTIVSASTSGVSPAMNLGSRQKFDFPFIFRRRHASCVTAHGSWTHHQWDSFAAAAPNYPDELPTRAVTTHRRYSIIRRRAVSATAPTHSTLRPITRHAGWHDSLTHTRCVRKLDNLGQHELAPIVDAARDSNATLRDEVVEDDGCEDATHCGGDCPSCSLDRLRSEGVQPRWGSNPGRLLRQSNQHARVHSKADCDVDRTTCTSASVTVGVAVCLQHTEPAYRLWSSAPHRMPK